MASLAHIVHLEFCLKWNEVLIMTKLIFKNNFELYLKLKNEIWIKGNYLIKKLSAN